MKKNVRKYASYVLLVGLCIVFLYPLVFLVANSLRHYIVKKPVLFLTEFHFENYYYAVAMIPFFKYLLNTIKIVVIALFGGVVVDFLIGYAFARLRAPGKELVFKLVLLQLIIPGIAVQIPQYVWYTKLDLFNTYWPFILAAVGGNAYNIFLVKQFLTSFPKSIEESAQIDGAGYFRQIISVIVPCSKPLLALLFFNAFVGGWNDYLGPQMFLTSDKFPLATAMFGNLYYIPNKPSLSLEPVTMAACVIFTVPVVILFFFFQKHLVKGIVTSGIKG